MGQNLTGQTISSTYEDLVQISGSILTDGLGVDITALTVTASNATSAVSASYATNAGAASTAISASHAVSANSAISSSYALTASYAANVPDTASFAISASHANNANSSISSSYAVNATSASYAVTASYAENANINTGSFMVTASAVANVITFEKANGSTFNVTVAQSGSVDSASYATFAATAGVANTASYVLGSNVDGAVANATSASYALVATSAATATSASFATNANTANSATTSISASHAVNADSAISASFATTAGSAGSATTAISASHAVNADTASFAVSASYAPSTIPGLQQVLNVDSVSTIGILISGSDGQNLITENGIQLSTDDINVFRLRDLTTNNGIEAIYDAVPNSASLSPIGGTTNFTITANNFIGTASLATSASHAVNADNAVTAQTASYATNFTVEGTLTAASASITYLTTVFETSSVIFSSGSNQFGDEAGDVQTLYGTVDMKNGPVKITGSLNVSGGITGSLEGTASYAVQALSASYAPPAATPNLQAVTDAGASTTNNITVNASLPTNGIFVTGTQIGTARNVDVTLAGIEVAAANVFGPITPYVRVVNDATTATGQLIIPSTGNPTLDGGTTGSLDIKQANIRLFGPSGNTATTITGSLNVTAGITGSLQGTASFAVSASYAPSTTPSLQAVTDVGATSTNAITVTDGTTQAILGSAPNLALSADSTFSVGGGLQLQSGDLLINPYLNSNVRISDDINKPVFIAGTRFEVGTGTNGDALVFTNSTASFSSTVPTASVATSASHAINADTASFAVSASYAPSSPQTLQEVTTAGNITTDDIVVSGSNIRLTLDPASNSGFLAQVNNDSEAFGVYLKNSDASETAQFSFQPDLNLASVYTNQKLYLQGVTGTYIDNIQYPSVDGTNGQVITTNGAGALSFSSTVPTASIATSASHAVNSDSSISASYALTASYLEGGVPTPNLQAVTTAGATTDQTITVTDGVTASTLIAGTGTIIEMASNDGTTPLALNFVDSLATPLAGISLDPATSTLGITANGGITLQNNTIISGSLEVTSGITGSLQGTASFAVSASYAPPAATPTLQEVTTAGNSTSNNIVATDSTTATNRIKSNGSGLEIEGIDNSTPLGFDFNDGNLSYYGSIKFDQTNGRITINSDGGVIVNGSASYATNALSSSYALTASYVDGISPAGLVAGTAPSSLKNANFLTLTPATASGTSSIALGNGAQAIGTDDIAIGSGSVATGGQSLAIGAKAITGGNQSIAIGENSTAEFSSMAIGYSADSDNFGTTVGWDSYARYGVALGRGATAGTIGSLNGGAAIGLGSQATKTGAVALGTNATATSVDYAVAIGHEAKATGSLDFVLTVSGSDLLLSRTGSRAIEIPGGAIITGSTLITGSLTVTGSISNFLPGTQQIVINQEQEKLAVKIQGGLMVGDAITGNQTDNSFVNFIAGERNVISNASTNAIAGARENRIENQAENVFIGGGKGNTIKGTIRGAIIGSVSSILSSSLGPSTDQFSVIVGGKSNTITNFSGSVVLGGQNLVATDHHQVVVPKLFVSESATFKNDVVVTGSLSGNVSDGTIVSNTASINLSNANFFNLTLVSGSNTHITATNITPGQTVNCKLTQPGAGYGSVTFDSMFKFPAGSNYTGSAAANAVDLISFVSFDSTNLYANAIENLI